MRAENVVGMMQTMTNPGAFHGQNSGEKPEAIEPLLNFQSFLLRLYTNQELRNRFFADQEAVFKDFALDERARKALGGLRPESVELLARGLTNNRAAISMKMVRANPGLIILSPFYRSCPAAFFMAGKTEKAVETPAAVFEMLRLMSPRLSFRNAFSAVANQNAAFRSAASAIIFIHQHRLWGRRAVVL